VIVIEVFFVRGKFFLLMNTCNYNWSNKIRWIHHWFEPSKVHYTWKRYCWVFPELLHCVQ